MEAVFGQSGRILKMHLEMSCMPLQTNIVVSAYEIQTTRTPSELIQESII